MECSTKKSKIVSVTMGRHLCSNNCTIFHKNGPNSQIGDQDDQAVTKEGVGSRKGIMGRTSNDLAGLDYNIRLLINYLVSLVRYGSKEAEA